MTDDFGGAPADRVRGLIDKLNKFHVMLQMLPFRALSLPYSSQAVDALRVPECSNALGVWDRYHSGAPEHPQLPRKAGGRACVDG